MSASAVNVAKVNSPLRQGVVIRRSSGVVSCTIANEAVLLNLNSGVYFGLDPVGARIWELIESPKSFGDLCRLLLEEYEVDGSVCEAAVASFLLELRSRELVDQSEKI